MTNRKKIKAKLDELGLAADKISYKACRSSAVYGDSAPSGQWIVDLENGGYYESCVDDDSVDEAVDCMLVDIEEDELYRRECERETG